jgi:hypothetical protein
MTQMRAAEAIAASLAVLALALGATACDPSAKPAARSPSPVTKQPTAAMNYAMIVPRAYQQALTPLIELRRQQGHAVRVFVVEDVVKRRAPAAEAEALRDELRELMNEHAELRYILLAGDPRGVDGSVPTFSYQLGSWAGSKAGQRYASDHGYVGNSSAAPSLGRLPARTPAELADMVAKTVEYEKESSGPWQSRLAFFGGPASMGSTIDSLVENEATTMLDELVPAAFDIRVLFAQTSSPYAYRFDKMHDQLVSEMSEGALLAVFAGHGNVTTLDSVKYRRKYYDIGTARDLAAVNVETGAPIFVALTCNAGTFDTPRRSIAERAILNRKGPVAVFAAGTISGAIPNFMLAHALIDELLSKRTDTLGKAVMNAELRLPKMSTIKFDVVSFWLPEVEGGSVESISEHPQIYNLFGDPALTPRYAAPITLRSSAEAVAPGETVTLEYDAPPGVFNAGSIAVERGRRQLPDGLVNVDTMAESDLETVFQAMTRNHELANKRVIDVGSFDPALAAGKTALVAPSAPGSYLVKMSLHGNNSFAAGAVRLTVR